MVIFHYLLTDGKPDPRPFVLILAMEPLENLKDPLAILRLEPDAIVAHHKRMTPFSGLVSQLDAGRYIFFAEFD